MSVLESVLRRTGRLVQATELARGALAGAAVVLAAALLAVALDAVLSLAVWALLAADAVLLALLAAGAVRVAWAAWVNRYEPRRLARLVERRLNIADSRLINGVDLSRDGAPSASEELRLLSVARSEKLAGELNASRAADWRALRKAAAKALAAAVVTAAAAVAFPGVFRAVLPRLADPLGGHAPFTLLKFDVRVEPRRVYHGREATIRAAIGGAARLPDQANVVFVDAGGRGAAPLPMLHAGNSPGANFALFIQRAERTRQFYIDTPGGRSGLFTLTVHAVPRIEAAVARYDFPPYTRWPAGAALLERDPSLAAIAGTRVTLTVRSNLPLAPCRAALAGTDGKVRQEVVLSPTAEAAEVQGSFVLAFSGRYSLSLLSADGVAGEDRLEGAMTCAPDEAPQVELVQPPRSSAAPEDWKVPVEATARDDVGVDRVLLLRGVNGWGPVPVELPLERSGPTYATGRAELDLGALGARPGDVITLHATARDNCPSPHLADSPTHVIRVISKMDYLRYARMKYRMEQIQGELDDYARRLEEIEKTRDELLKAFEELLKKADAGALSEEDMRRLAQLAARQRDSAARMNELAERLRRRLRQPPLYEFEMPLNESLARLAEDMEAFQRQTDRLTESYRPSGGQTAVQRHLRDSIAQLRESGAGMEAGRQRMQLTKRQAEQLRKADEMVALTEQVAAIAAQQRELADRMGQFRSKEQLSPSEQLRARRLADEQQQLRGELEEALAALEKAARDNAKVLPKMSASAAKLAGAVRQLNVLRDQADAVSLAQAGQGRYAHRSADDAATKLESLIRDCCGAAGAMEAACEDFDKELALTRQQIMLTLQQLVEGRGLPGAKGRGGEGGGYYGSRATMTLLGPHQGGGESDASRGFGSAGKGRPGGASDPGSSRPAAESIRPEPHRQRSAGVRAMPGVPVRYRGLAELYFQRLADESK